MIRLGNVAKFTINGTDVQLGAIYSVLNRQGVKEEEIYRIDLQNLKGNTEVTVHIEK